MSAFRMPSLGADMDAGTLVEWFKQPGDRLKRGDIIALVETQKGAIEIEVFEDGTLDAIKVQPGEKVPVGTVLALIDGGEAEAEAAPSPAGAPVAPTEPRPAVAGRPTVVGPAPASPAAAGARRKVTPAARRAAEQRGLDLAGIPSGADGIIGLRELSAAAPEAGPPGAASPVALAAAARRPAGLDLAEMRKAIAAAMARSHRDIPHFWVAETIDVTPLMEWLERENAARSIERRLLYAVPLIKAVARALKETPELNGAYADGAFTAAPAVHLGIATALRGGGLVAPALHDADRLDLDAIMAALADLVPRVRAGRLRSSEMTDATATLSNLGEGTSEMMMPLIYPPQVAIIGCGTILPRPWVVDDRLAIRRVMTVTVAGDHRVSDGRRASQFLGRLARHLEKPEAL